MCNVHQKIVEFLGRVPAADFNQVEQLNQLGIVLQVAANDG